MIDFGDDFAEIISNAVGSCDVLLAVIGREWSTITDAAGCYRLDDPNDFVRVEIEAALQRGMRVIPILVQGATRAAAGKPGEAGAPAGAGAELDAVRI